MLRVLCPESLHPNHLNRARHHQYPGRHHTGTAQPCSLQIPAATRQLPSTAHSESSGSMTVSLLARQPAAFKPGIARQPSSLSHQYLGHCYLRTGYRPVLVAPPQDFTLSVGRASLRDGPTQLGQYSNSLLPPSSGNGAD